MAELRDCLIAWQDVSETRWSVLSFDGVVREGHQGSLVVTQYPTDKGYKVSEHTIRQNRQIEIEAVISNISMSVATSVKSFRTSFLELLTSLRLPESNTTYDTAEKHGRAEYDNNRFGVDLLNSLTAEVSLEKVDDTLDIINKLNERGTLVHIVTMRKIYHNCVIREFTATNDVKDAYCLPIRLSLEQLNVVEVIPDNNQNATKNVDGLGVAAEQDTVLDSAVNGFVTKSLPKSKRITITKETDDYSIQTIAANYSNLDHVEVPFSTTVTTRFTYNGVEYALSKLLWSDSLECFTTNLEWRQNGERRFLNSIPLFAGVNVLQQSSVEIPSLVPLNTDTIGADPVDTVSLKLYIIEEYDKYFLE